MIKILGLNDDYHDTIFYDEEGHSYHMGTLIWILSQPHDKIYDVRYLLLPNINEDDEYTTEQFMTVSEDQKHGTEYKKAFNHLWNYINTEKIMDCCIG